MKDRVHYIDNLRWITVFLLVLYHVAMAYNTWGEANYIFFEAVRPISAIVVFISPWFMPLMFLLAGVSASFSLAKRGYVTFIKERFSRLGTPLIIGLIFLIPILSHVADVTHNGYKGDLFAHYPVFFTKFTDLTGYDGGFSLGHLWFITVLILISFISCGVIKLLENVMNKNKAAMTVIGVILTVTAVLSFDVKLIGKPLITYLCVYLIGFYFFSDKEFVNRIVKLKWLYTAVFLISSAANVVLFIYIGGYELLNNICNRLSFVSGVLALISLGHDHLDRTGPFAAFNSKISYIFYIIHFPLVVRCQYLLDSAGVKSITNFFLSVLICYPITYLACYMLESFLKPKR
ncbi:MAG: acyltransferase [Saccharofermentans sp.]|nr:acyltransferase [Saccharofermentans sp.]